MACSARMPLLPPAGHAAFYVRRSESEVPGLRIGSRARAFRTNSAHKLPRTLPAFDFLKSLKSSHGSPRKNQDHRQSRWYEEGP